MAIVEEIVIPAAAKDALHAAAQEEEKSHGPAESIVPDCTNAAPCH
jgi:hypothetical protein